MKTNTISLIASSHQLNAGDWVSGRHWATGNLVVEA